VVWGASREATTAPDHIETQLRTVTANAVQAVVCRLPFLAPFAGHFSFSRWLGMVPKRPGAEDMPHEA